MCLRLEGSSWRTIVGRTLSHTTSSVTTICLTVLLSVLAHGLSADPLAQHYGAWAQRTRPTQELLPSTEPRTRRSLHHRDGDVGAAGTGGLMGSNTTGKAIGSFWYLPLYLREQSQTIVE